MLLTIFGDTGLVVFAMGRNRPGDPETAINVMMHRDCNCYQYTLSPELFH